MTVRSSQRDGLKVQRLTDIGKPPFVKINLFCPKGDCQGPELYGQLGPRGGLGAQHRRAVPLSPAPSACDWHPLRSPIRQRDGPFHSLRGKTPSFPSASGGGGRVLSKTLLCLSSVCGPKAGRALEGPGHSLWSRGARSRSLLTDPCQNPLH